MGGLGALAYSFWARWLLAWRAMGSAAELPALPERLPLDRVALFLDFDGTLVEIAPAPDAVQVPPSLVALLRAGAEGLQGALALVSGRRLDDLDARLAPLVLPTAAEHGALRRLAHGRLIESRPPALAAATHMAEALVQAHPGLRLERKTCSVALHYRQRPDLEALCLAAMTQACEHSADTELQRGKCVVELRPLGVNKGQAIACFMKEPPFAGRQPWFAGDDLTDESGFAWVQHVGGTAIKLGPGASQARHRLAGPAELRAWLERVLKVSAPPGGARSPLGGGGCLAW